MVFIQNLLMLFVKVQSTHFNYYYHEIYIPDFNLNLLVIYYNIFNKLFDILYVL